MGAVKVTITDGSNVRAKLSGPRMRSAIGEWTQDILFEVSQEVLREEESKGFDKDARVRTDNKWENPAHYVKPFGKIEYFARDDMGAAIMGVYDRLLELSPVGATMYYRNTHIVTVNGKVVADTRQRLKMYIKHGGLKSGDIVRIVNPMPYARMLELEGYRKGLKGKLKGIVSKGKRVLKRNKKKVLRMPNGVYFVTARYAKSAFKSSAESIRFQFLTGSAIGLTKPWRSRQPNGAPFRTNFKKDHRPYLYPTITFKISEHGVMQ